MFQQVPCYSEIRKVPYTEVYVNRFGMVKYDGKYSYGFSNKCGYKVIKTKEGKFYYVHRLVARVFCDNPCPEKFVVVHHKDGRRDNNVASNLEWTTKALNNAWKKNQNLVRKIPGGWKVQFVFDKKTYKLHKLFKFANHAQSVARKYKMKLINDKREYIIQHTRANRDPNEEIEAALSRFIENRS